MRVGFSGGIEQWRPVHWSDSVLAPRSPLLLRSLSIVPDTGIAVDNIGSPGLHLLRIPLLRQLQRAQGVGEGFH